MLFIVLVALASATAILLVVSLILRKAEIKYRDLVGIGKNIVKEQEKLNELELLTIAKQNELIDATVEHNDKIKVKEQLDNDLRVIQAQKDAAQELAVKGLELEREKRMSKFIAELEKEEKELRASSQIEKSKEELDRLNAEINAVRQTLKVQQEQATNAIKEEDFKNFHSIGFSEQDAKDVSLIREFAPRLTRQEAFNKLIWTEFYQKPIQSLCKAVEADKVTGIYKITNIDSDRMYIGQALDIAARWKEHCKCALGIGSTSYQTNKFYKAMHDIGIENFTFEVLEVCPKEKLNEREFFYIDFYNATTFGFNSKAGG